MTAPNTKNLHSGVTLAVGAVVAVVGIVLKAENDAHNALCNLGAAFQSSVALQHQCLFANVGSTAGAWMVPLGVLAIVVGVAGLIFFSKSERAGQMLPATLFAHGSAALGDHRSASLCDDGGPLTHTVATVSPG